MTTEDLLEDLLLEFMAKVNNALSLEDDALRLRAIRLAKHWAEVEYAHISGQWPIDLLREPEDLMPLDLIDVGDQLC
jgi:hypothetical protein